MKSKTQHFPKLTKKEWIEVIEKSLKNGQLSDFVWQVDQEVEGLPFAHREDVAADIPPLTQMKGENDWLIGLVVQEGELPEKLEAYDAVFIERASSLQDQIQKLLGKGASLQEISLPYSKSDIKSHLNWWNVGTLGTRGAELQIVIPYKVFPALDLKELISLSVQKGLSFKLMLQMGKTSDKSLVEEWAKFLGDLHNKLAALESEDLLKGFFQMFRLGHWVNSAQILLETAQIRALRLLLYNLQKALIGQVVEVPVQAFISLDQLTQDKNHQLILATSAGLAAVLGGAQGLYYQSKYMNHERDRLFRNIQWLLKEEAGLAVVEDPLAGSYAVENLTENLASMVWQRLVK